MCQALEELYQDGVIKGAIELCREFGMSKEATQEKIKEKYSLEEEKVREYLDEYWK